jgi:N-acetylgalactosamine kinase
VRLENVVFRESIFENLLAQKFELCKRLKHVFSEANRVLIFKQVCDSNTHDPLETLGELMNQSHFSCSKLYECSSDELDELTDICRYVYLRFSIQD